MQRIEKTRMNKRREEEEEGDSLLSTFPIIMANPFVLSAYNLSYSEVLDTCQNRQQPINSALRFMAD